MYASKFTSVNSEKENLPVELNQLTDRICQEWHNMCHLTANSCCCCFDVILLREMGQKRLQESSALMGKWKIEKSRTDSGLLWEVRGYLFGSRCHDNIPPQSKEGHVVWHHFLK